MRRLLTLLATRSGNLLHYANVAGSLELDGKTVKSYIELLEAIFLVRRIPAWRPGLLQRVVHAPKVYVTDSGLLAHLLGADERRIAQDDRVTGIALETFAAMEILKLASWSETEPRAYHFRDRRGRKARNGAKVSANGSRRTEGCKRCRENPFSVCIACTQRRRRAMQLREQDRLSDEQIAARMRLSLPRVQRLLEEETQYRDLQQYVCNSVPAELLQDRIRRRQLEDPALTKEEIAERAGYCSREALLRAVGLEPTARRVRPGKVYPPKLEKTVEVAIASKIVRALGFAPHEIPGL